MREWFVGLSSAQRYLTVLLLSICLATLPFYALALARLSPAEPAGPEGHPDPPVALADKDLPAPTPTRIATQTRPTETATSTTKVTAVPTEAATSTPEPTPTAGVRRGVAELRALATSSVRGDFKRDKERKFLREIDDLADRLHERKLGNARQAVRNLADQAADLKRRGDLDRRLADQIIVQLERLATDL